MEYWKGASIIAYTYAVTEYTPSPSHIIHRDDPTLPWSFIDHYSPAVPAIDGQLPCPCTAALVHTGMLPRSRWDGARGHPAHVAPPVHGPQGRVHGAC